MKTLSEFKETLSLEQPANELSIQLKSLWYDGKGDWDQAHSQVDHLSDRASALVHAYLHRKEGDTTNADYWYHKARQTRPDISLQQEWERLVSQFLTQRSYRTTRSEATVKIDLSGMANGQRAGISHFGAPSYAAAGIVQTSKGKQLQFFTKDKITGGPIIKSNTIWLRSNWGLDGRSNFSYSADGKDFQPFGETYQLQWGSYRGDRLAIYNFNDEQEAGFVDVDYFHYQYLN